MADLTIYTNTAQGTEGQIPIVNSNGQLDYTAQSNLSVGHASTSDSATSAGHATTADSATTSSSAGSAPVYLHGVILDQGQNECYFAFYSALSARPSGAGWSWLLGEISSGMSALMVNLSQSKYGAGVIAKQGSELNIIGSIDGTATTFTFNSSSTIAFDTIRSV